MVDEDYDKLLQYALRIISKKRYTVFEMRNKLENYVRKRKKIGMEHVEPAMDRLFELEYLDDEQFVKDYIAQRIRLKPRGKVLIKRELRIKGIPKNLIEPAFEKIEIDEEKMATDLLSGRVSRLKKFPVEKQREKAYQFLYSKGFSRDAIYKAIDTCYNA